MDTAETPHQKSGIYNYFGGATIHKLIINGNITENGNEYNKTDNKIKESTDSVKNEENSELVNALKPIFYGDVDETKSFLADIQGVKPTQVTERVNAYLRMNKISGKSSRRDLWVILHENGLYDKSESNWNQQII